MQWVKTLPSIPPMVVIAMNAKWACPRLLSLFILIIDSLRLKISKMNEARDRQSLDTAGEWPSYTPPFFLGGERFG